MRRRRFVSWVVLAAALVIGTEVACVIAQPTDTVPTLPASRPVIIRTRVQPPVSAVLTSWQTSYTLYVELVDPTVDLVYATFIDYNSLTGAGLTGGRQKSTFSGNTIPADRVRTFDVALGAPPDLDRCHVIEIVVSLPFDTNDPRGAHSPPDPPGGDTVSWFYAPGGDLTGCPVLDAGIEASVIEDAAAESESGAR